MRENTIYTVDSLLEVAMNYKEQLNDCDNALKYAMLAASVTYSPRADVCCLIGEIYLTKGNMMWAKIWYESALNNVSVGIDEVMPQPEYFQLIPLQKLTYINYSLGYFEDANRFNEAVLAIDGENEAALANKKELEGLIKIND